ncbi:putative toxin-antitoxin system toxin component, PIN family [Spirosoma spitsbergense]|uniref:putative toxin-antitoxin system toxin component, PIN family n=1 Tax=Spirosoma spitsbergense TaxID=431554 RepID=UPI00037ADD78|nr:putative toxin-antitoxin system toxin component, PIN family [Spirosoma spitsbergense]
MTIVLDTNVLLACYSPKSRLYPIWQAFRQQRYTLCVTTDMLTEYAEILTRHATPALASLILDIILQSPNTTLITKHFFWQLITADPDDNKFADCALLANADYIVTEDRHFDVLNSVPFPTINLLRADEFLALLA